MKRIAFMIGSLRAKSFNRRLSEAAKEIIGNRAEVVELDIRDVPMMNQDIEYPPAESVVRLRKEVGYADGVWIFSPENNYSYPAVVKNAIDWLSRPVTPGDYKSRASAGVKVTVSNVAGKSAGANVRQKLFELMKSVEFDVMESPSTGIVIPDQSWISDKIEFDETDLAPLRAQAEAFLSFI